MWEGEQSAGGESVPYDDGTMDNQYLLNSAPIFINHLVGFA